jgi:hypothetical protein
VEYLRHINLEDGLSQGIITHISRYAVVFPAYWASNFFDIDIILVYTAYVKTVVFLTSLCWINMSMSKFRSPLRSAVVGCTPYLLLNVINGRFAFCLCGFALLYLSYYNTNIAKNTVIRPIVDLLGVLLTSVSSGTFMVAASILVCKALASNPISSSNHANAINVSHRLMPNSLQIIRFPISLSRLRSKLFRFEFDFFVYVLIAFCVIMLIGLFVSKNLDYFGGLNLQSLFEMFSHGMGFVVNASRTLSECSDSSSRSLISVCNIAETLERSELLSGLALLTFFATVCLSLLYVSSAKSLDQLAKCTIYASMIFGLFGLTTLMSAISVIPVFGRCGIRVVSSKC